MALSAQQKTMTAEEFHPKTLDSKLKREDGYRDGHDDIESFGELVAAERENEIKYRTCSWQKVGTSTLVCIIYRLTVTDCRPSKTAALLFSEYICLAILSFPWYVRWSWPRAICSHVQRRSFSVLGLVPGVLVTLAVAGTVLYTSLVLWRFCLQHPDILDVCDIGQKLFWGSPVAYEITSVFFILNNTFIQGIYYSSIVVSSY
jgi:hypothetical protein